LRTLKLGILFLLLAAVSSAATLLYSSDFIADLGNPIPAGTTYAAGPAGGGGIGGPVNLVAPQAGTLIITVTDCCLVGDVYEVILNGTSLGWTSEVSIGGPTNSMGVFYAPIGAGMFSVDVWDITISYIGSPSPFGGGIVDNFYSPAGGYLTVELEAIPEPGTWMLMSAGLAGLVAFSRRRK
jgi:hypothetical protein